MSGEAPEDRQAGRIAAGSAPRGSMFAAFTVPSYPRLWAIGLFISQTRWMTIFLASYLINDLTQSPFLVQLAGVALFAPLFAGGLLAGVIADRLDRRRTLIAAVLLLIPGAALLAYVITADRVEVWMVYPFVFAAGLAHLIDMTSRRALVYECVGPALITNAIALESLAMMSGAMIGSLIAGSIISLLGIGEVFVVLAVLNSVTLFLLLGLKAGPKRDISRPALDLVGDLIAGIRYARGERALLSVLGITILMNLFYFSYMPLVPVFGERLGVSAFWSGVLVSGHALGSIVGAAMIARGPRVGRGVIYVAGSAVALVFLFLFAAISWYPAALAALVIAGFGIAGFATMQSTLVLVSANDEMRGRATGMLSMSIGALPFSMLLLGGFASFAGPATGVMTSTALGLLALVLFSLWRPEAQKLV